MTINPPDAARKAREALGLRLREIRKDAGLTGRELAAATGWHFTRVSKLEHGVQVPSNEDIRLWCAACSAEGHSTDLIARARAVESTYLEYKRQTRAGMKQLMLKPVPLYQRTSRFRIYEHRVMPGLFQTSGYARAILEFWSGFLDIKSDVDEAVAARMDRQHVLYDNSKTFAVVLEDSVLTTRFCEADALAGQLDRLLSVMSLPNVSIGIVPATRQREAIGQVSFWMFDDRLVSLETPTASIEVTAPQEIALYGRMFDLLHQSAVYGKDARALVIKAQSELADSN
ncbi:helix-turn-helix domain-containing protein [Kribbella sp. CA-294648]|uniref:helix-turn-helix domain-containing protein n=1 Tax=Kribbella sp. CA-294648 TaxID=3239948 RepID=UPI003D926FE9